MTDLIQRIETAPEPRRERKVRKVLRDNPPPAWLLSAILKAETSQPRASRGDFESERI